MMQTRSALFEALLVVLQHRMQQVGTELRGFCAVLPEVVAGYVVVQSGVVKQPLRLGSMSQHVNMSMLGQHRASFCP